GDAALRPARPGEAARHRLAVSRRRRGRRARGGGDMSDEHAPGLGPVMAFTAKRAEVVRCYTEIAGLKAEPERDATWVAAENAQQALAQRAARDSGREQVLPRAREIDEQGKVPRELIAEMASLGFLGIYVPESYGGAGLDALSYALVSEEINRACASTGVVMS